LTVTKDGLVALAETAVRKGTGARALRSLLEKIMLDVMYEAPDRDDLAGVTVNRAVVEGRRPALIRRRQEKDAA
jgi:ATP-dependent Clp protease ATP-binding subunit ClpX